MGFKILVSWKIVDALHIMQSLNSKNKSSNKQVPLSEFSMESIAMKKPDELGKAILY